MIGEVIKTVSKKNTRKKATPRTKKGPRKGKKNPRRRQLHHWCIKMFITPSGRKFNYQKKKVKHG